MKKIIILSALLPLMAMASEPTYSIKSTVWHDSNQNWEQDNGEQGIAGVTVKLFNEKGKNISTTKTIYDGTYKFKELPEGDYAVKVVVPEIMTAVTNTKLEIWLDKNRINQNFGLYNEKHKGDYSIGSMVWDDANENWEQDNDEQGIAGVTVKLFNEKGKNISTTKTIYDGTYKFKELPEGDYAVKVVVPEDVKAITDTTLELYLDKNITDKNFGLYQKIHKGNLKISSYIWNDSNQNWKKDIGEKGINGVKVILYKTTGEKVATTFTKQHMTNRRVHHHTFLELPGYYKFSKLVEGDYIIKVEPPKGFASSTESKLELWLEANSVHKKDFGIYKKNFKPQYTFKSTIWVDKDKNKYKGYSEGINGVKVHLYNSNGKKIASTITSKYHNRHYTEQGIYTFSVEEGDYMVKIDLPKGMTTKSTEKYIYINTSHEDALNFQLQAQ